MAELSKEEFLTHIGYVREDIDEVKQHLRELNGRTRTNENEIAVLNDRSTNGRDPAARWTAGIVGAAGILVEIAHQWFKAK